MKKILFIGSFVPDKFQDYLEINSEAGNNFQLNLITELKKYNKVQELSYIGYSIQNFFNSKIILSKNPIFIYKYAILDLVFKIKKIVKMIKENEVIIFYNHNYFNDFFKIFIPKYKKQVLILADFCEIQEEKNIIKKILAFKAKREFRKYDGIICLSSNMMRYNKNSINIFGGSDVIKYKKFSTPLIIEEQLIILYSGLLDEVTGVDMLLRVTSKIKDKNIKFIFTGKGRLEKEIIELSQKDLRVKYLGFLSKEKFHNLLEKSNILINPRNMNLPQNKNNFPSKILEYLTSGRVVISTKFPEYKQFEENIFFCESKEEDIEKTLKKVILNYNKLKDIYYYKNIEKVKEFSWINQGEKINKFIKEL